MSKKTAGAFDIRNIIAMLIGIYGIVITFLGIFSADDHELDKADGLNINLWAGIVMIAVAALMVLWSVLRPVVIPSEAEQQEQDARSTGGATVLDDGASDKD